MGIAAGWVWGKGFHHKYVKTGLYHFGFQLLLNALWSIVFFGLKSPFYALWVIIALLIMLILTIKWFKVVSKLAAILLIPYLLWVCFATLLNYKIWELNCRTYPIKLELESINKWETKMWEIGYKFDCELDGWETTYENR
jgi:tryptophan-rich sensory protein